MNMPVSRSLLLLLINVLLAVSVKGKLTAKLEIWGSGLKEYMFISVNSGRSKKMEDGDRLMIKTKSGKEEIFEYEEYCLGYKNKRNCFSGPLGPNVQEVSLRQMNAKLKAPAALEWKKHKGAVVGSWTSGAHDAYVNAYDYGYDYAGDEEDEYDQQVDSFGLEDELDDMLNDMFMAGYQKGLSVAQERRHRYNN